MQTRVPVIGGTVEDVTWGELASTSAGTLLAAWAFLLLALAGLGLVLFKLELSPAARRRRRLQQALARAERRRAEQEAQARSASGRLTPQELSRLAALRNQMRLAEERLTPPSWLDRLRFLWREGYSGWIIASLVGAFSMATHFGAFWLIAGGGWLGATLITLGSTVLMVAAC